MNRNLLKGKIAENGETQETLACALGISLSRLNAKINSKNSAMFNQSEISFIAKRYSLTPKEIVAIFFSKKAS